MDRSQMEKNIASYVPDERALKLVKEIEHWRTVLDQVKPIVRAYKQQVLERLKFKIELEDGLSDEKKKEMLETFTPNGYLAKPEGYYLLSEDDQEIYFDAVLKAKIESGLPTEETDFCPELEAWANLDDARQTLIAHMEPVTGISITEVRTSNYQRIEQLATLYESTIKFQLVRQAAAQQETDSEMSQSPSIH